MTDSVESVTTNNSLQLTNLVKNFTEMVQTENAFTDKCGIAAKVLSFLPLEPLDDEDRFVVEEAQKAFEAISNQPHIWEQSGLYLVDLKRVNDNNELVNANEDYIRNRLEQINNFLRKKENEVSPIEERLTNCAILTVLQPKLIKIISEKFHDVQKQLNDEGFKESAEALTMEPFQRLIRLALFASGWKKMYENLNDKEKFAQRIHTKLDTLLGSLNHLIDKYKDNTEVKDVPEIRKRRFSLVRNFFRYYISYAPVEPLENSFPDSETLGEDSHLELQQRTKDSRADVHQAVSNALDVSSLSMDNDTILLPETSTLEHDNDNAKDINDENETSLIVDNRDINAEIEFLNSILVELEFDPVDDDNEKSSKASTSEKVENDAKEKIESSNLLNYTDSTTEINENDELAEFLSRKPEIIELLNNHLANRKPMKREVSEVVFKSPVEGIEQQEISNPISNSKPSLLDIEDRFANGLAALDTRINSSTSQQKIYLQAQYQLLNQAHLVHQDPINEKEKEIALNILTLIESNALTISKLEEIQMSIKPTDSRPMQLIGAGLVILSACIITFGVLAAIPTGGTSLLASLGVLTSVIASLGAVKTALALVGGGLLAGAIGLGLFKVGRKNGLDEAVTHVLDVMPQIVRTS